MPTSQNKQSPITCLELVGLFATGFLGEQLRDPAPEPGTVLWEEGGPRRQGTC